METAATVIQDALQEIQVQGSESPVMATDQQTGIRYLNRMMTSLAAKGINLGYTVVTHPNDPITIADGAIEGMVSLLAIRLCTQYDIPPTPLLMNSGKEGLASMRALSINISPSSYGATLPRGSGNEWFGDSYHFYDTAENLFTSETNNNLDITEE